MVASHQSLSDGIEDVKNLALDLDLSSDVIRRAMSRAVNRTIRSLRQSIVVSVASETRLKQNLIRNRMKIVNSRKASLEARLLALGYSIPAILLGGREVKIGGVRAGSRYYRSAFVRNPKRKRGKRRDMIFERKTKERYPLFERRIRIYESLDREFTLQQDKIGKIFLRNFRHELDVRARGIVK